MFDTLTSKIQSDIPDGNRDLQTYNEPAVELTVDKMVSTQLQTGIHDVPVEYHKRESTNQDESINEPHPSISSQKITPIHHETPSVAEQIEDIQSAISTLKPELESLQSEPSGISNYMSGHTQSKASQADELSQKGGISNTDNGKSENLPTEEQIKEKYNTDISDSLNSSTDLSYHSPGQINLNSFNNTLDLQGKIIADHPVVAEKTLDEVLKVDIVKEEEESLRPETHYHSREDAQYPRADYGEQESTVNSRKTLESGGGVESAVIDSEDKSTIFQNRNESSLSDRGEHSSVTDTDGGSYVTDSEKGLAFTDSGKRSLMTDSEDKSAMTEKEDQSNVSRNEEGMEELIMADTGKGSSIISNSDKSTVNERRDWSIVVEKGEVSPVVNSEEELKLTEIGEGSSVMLSEKKSLESAHIESEEGLIVSKSKEGSVDIDVDNIDMTATADVSVEEVVLETSEINKVNVWGPHLMSSTREEENQISSSLVNEGKEYQGSVSGKDEKECIETLDADTVFSEEMLHKVDDLSVKSVNTDGDENKLSHQVIFSEQIETGQQFVKSEDTRIWYKTLIDEQTDAIDDKKGKEGQVLPQSSTEKSLGNSDNRIPHVRTLDSHSGLLQTKSDYTPEATAGGTYKKTLIETEEAATEIHPESIISFSVGNSKLEKPQMATEDFSEVNQFQDEISTSDESMAITCGSLSICSQCANQKETCAENVNAGSVYTKTAEQEEAADVPTITSDISQGEAFAEETNEMLMEEAKFVKGSSYSESKPLSSSGKHSETYRMQSDKTDTMNQQKSSEAQTELQRTEKEQLVLEVTHGEKLPLHQELDGSNEYSDHKVISNIDADFTSTSSSKPREEQSTTTDKSNVENSEDIFLEGSIDAFSNGTISEEHTANEPTEEITETSQQKKYAETAQEHIFPESQSHRIPDSPKDTFKSANILREYKNIQQHMTEEDLLQVLDILGRHKLLWLDYHLGNPEDEGIVESFNDDLPILSDFERMLQYHIEMTVTSKGSQDDDVKAQVKNIPLEKLKTLLSTIKSRFSPERPAVNINSNQAGTDRPEYLHASISNGEKDRDAREGDIAAGINRLSEDEELHTTGQSSAGFHQSPVSTYKTGVTDVIALCVTFAGQVAVQCKDRIQSSFSLLEEVVSSLPSDMTPGPDLLGLPWEAVIPAVLVGIITLLLFTCRSYQSIKSRLYVGKERKMGQKVAELLEEKCKVLETLSQCQHKYEELEEALQNGGISAHASEREDLEIMSRKLEESNSQLNKELEQLKQDLKAQTSMRSQQEEVLAGMQETLKSLEEESKGLKSKIEQAQITVKIHNISSEKLQTNLQVAKEENAQLLESKAQLVQEAEGWAERLSELEEEMKMCESSHKAMLEDCSNKDQHIKSLTDCLLKMRDWDSEEEDQAIEEEQEGTSVGAGDNRDGPDVHQKQKVQKLIYAAKMSADLKSLEEEKNRLFARLADEVKAKEDLREGIERLHNEKETLQAESATYTSETQKLQQKLQIMTEMYQENELKLHSMLTVEERERLQKEEKLNKADKKISQAAEELNTYRQRAQELEEELEKTNQAYKNQIAAHEKKAHDNWLAARAADRDLADMKRENALLRQKLTDSQFKLEMVEKDPFSGRPPFRGERSPFGHSPLGRPSSETRAFLSPPTLMDGPPRLSPQFPLGHGGRVSRGPPSLPDHPVASEGEGHGPHSDSGSVSPTWERDRRGPVPPPGYPYPDPGFHYRRPPPGAMPLGPLPPRGPGPAEVHVFSTRPMDRSDASLLSSHSDGLGLNENRNSFLSAPGDPRIPAEADIQKDPGMGIPTMGPPPLLDPRQQLPRRGLYGPPDFFPPRGPPMGMRGPPPPGIFPRFPPPPPQHMGYPPIRPLPDSLSGPPRRPSPPGSEQPPEQVPSQEII
ncbi:cTAGE family member 5 isoform X2 [Scleropages formosus]|uniref:cTAGE family member 5 isoform X2 n=1 Tax=Scleropages formosus TaxID=113540 RepID=UPI0010FA7E48|nr:melanoma inhibitory activity protein 2 isoform X2 [Scleropages formosus]